MSNQIDLSWIGKDGHDFASPSRLNLCLHCPGNCRLRRQTEMAFTQRSEAADRGNELHALAVHVLEGKIDFETLKPQLSPEDFEQLKWVVDRTREIIARFKDSGAIVRYEQQIDLSELGISGGIHGCRIDVHILVIGHGSVVIDWKFGKKWVTEPRFNMQIKAYGWGSWNRFGGNQECIILQPQSPEGKDYMSYVFEDGEFTAIGDEINTIVTETRKENAPLHRGWWCKDLFCPMYPDVCPLHKTSILEIPDGKNAALYVKLLSPEERGKFYATILTAIAFANKCKAVCDFMAIEENLPFAGYEVKPGKSSYVCNNTDKFISELSPFATKKGLEPKALLTDPIPALPKCKSDTEKLLGKSKEVSEVLKSLYTVVSGKPILKEIK